MKFIVGLMIGFGFGQYTATNRVLKDEALKKKLHEKGTAALDRIIFGKENDQ